jgi:hypothetical protein
MSTWERVTSEMPVPFRCAPVVPKYVLAGCQAPDPASAASTRTLTLTLLIPAPTRQSEWTPGAVLLPVFPRMLVPLSACVVASLTTAPLVNVSVARTSTAGP